MGVSLQGNANIRGKSSFNFKEDNTALWAKRSQKVAKIQNVNGFA